MVTRFDKDSLLFAEAEQSPIGPRVVLIVEGERVAGMAPEQAADFGALLVAKAAEAIGEWAGKSTTQVGATLAEAYQRVPAQSFVYKCVDAREDDP